uniref:EamA domain-containing protein n=1 Tax=Pinguiococcus pyrenoidosus TaxID=172671 RepID=A0A7R9UAU3_9STRA
MARAALLAGLLSSLLLSVGGLLARPLATPLSSGVAQYRSWILHVAQRGNEEALGKKSGAKAAHLAHRTTLDQAIPGTKEPQNSPLPAPLDAEFVEKQLDGRLEDIPVPTMEDELALSEALGMQPLERAKDVGEGPLDGAASGSLTTVETPKDDDVLFYKALLVLVAVFWGTNFPAVRFIEGYDVSSSSLAALRFGIAGLVLAPTLAGKPRALLLAGLECGLWAAAGYVAQAIGLEVVEANKAAFICCLHVVLVPFLSKLLGVADVKGRQWVAAVLALLGVGLLEGADTSLPSASDALLLLQPLGFGISYIKIEEAAKRFPGECTALSAAQLVTVALVSFAWVGVDCFNGVSPAISAVTSSPTAIAAVLYTGLITTALTIYLQTLALEKVSATDMTVIISTEPLVAAVVSVLALGERLSPLGAVGGAIIFGTCLWSQLTGENKQKCADVSTEGTR